eukprot:9580384-Prorocentrum_lima.AAC.1
MKCIGRPNVDGGRTLADQQGDEDSFIADRHPLEDHATCCLPTSHTTTLKLLPVKACTARKLSLIHI